MIQDFQHRHLRYEPWGSFRQTGVGERGRKGVAIHAGELAVEGATNITSLYVTE